MYCPNCGKQSPTGAPNCHSCGAPLTGAMQQPRKSSSTTIIVVIVAVLFIGFFVVAILGAILFPVFARAREAARTSSCQSNIKQLATAMHVYAADYDDALPPGDKWCDLLQTKVATPEVYVCPNVSEMKCGYGLNSSIFQLRDVTAPDGVVMLYESDGGWNAYGPQGAMISVPRHGKYNIAFVDGHVSGVYQTEVSYLKWTAQ